MSVYLGLIIYILLCAILFRGDRRRFVIFAVLGLFCVMGFRNARMVGNDSSSSYYLVFREVLPIGSGYKNIGLGMIMQAIKMFTSDYQIVIIVSAAWVCFAYYRLISKYSENTFISIMWFLGMLFYTFMFSALKQAWAMAFLCFAFDAVMERKIRKFVFFVALATTFHFPALIFLPAYWIYTIKNERNYLILLASLFAVTYVFRGRILLLMTSVYGGMSEEYVSSASFLGTKVILMVLIIVYGYFKYRNAGEYDEEFILLLYFMGIAAVIQTFSFYNNIFERLADYYYVFSILFMPKIVNQRVPCEDGDSYMIEMNGIGMLIACVITVFCIARFLLIVNSGADFLSPYYFFWQGLSTKI